MNCMTVLKGFVLLLISVFLAKAGEDPENTAGLSVGIFDSDAVEDDAVMLRITGSHALTPHVDLIGEVQYHALDGDERSANVYAGLVSLAYIPFARTRPLRPYLLFGLGYHFMYYEEDERTTEIVEGAHVGAGLDWILSPGSGGKYRLTLDARQFHAGNPSTENVFEADGLAFSAGFKLRL